MLNLRSGSQRHRHFVGFFNVPVQAPTRDPPFYGYSEKPPHFSRLLRHAWGYGGHILDLTPGCPRRNLPFRSNRASLSLVILPAFPRVIFPILFPVFSWLCFVERIPDKKNIFRFGLTHFPDTRSDCPLFQTRNEDLECLGRLGTCINYFDNVSKILGPCMLGTN